MTRAQAEILTNIVGDDTVTVKSIEYPAYPDGQADINDVCLKVVYAVEIENVMRTWVDWYSGDGRVASTRELVEFYNQPSWAERQNS